LRKSYRSVYADSVQASRIGLPSRECERAVSLTYLITFTCYGAHVHGDQSGTVDRKHNLPGSRLLNPDPVRAAIEGQLMQHRLYLLDETRRVLVLGSLHEVCSHCGWNLLAAHVRMNHVHTVVEANTRPEKIMATFKILCKSSFEHVWRRRTWLQAVVTARKHKVSLEPEQRFGRDQLRYFRTRTGDGSS
jgi:REP element-mobilizing transposase RayT